MASIATFLPKIPSSLPSSSKRDPSPFSSNFLFISTKKRPSPSLPSCHRQDKRHLETLRRRRRASPPGPQHRRVRGCPPVGQEQAGGRRVRGQPQPRQPAHLPLHGGAQPHLRRRRLPPRHGRRVRRDPRALPARRHRQGPPLQLLQGNGEAPRGGSGIGPDQLVGDVLYYGDKHAGVVQLHCREDVEALIDEHRGAEGKLVVLDVGLKHCGPCVKVYPTVIKLSRSMADAVVFARLNGDENDSCLKFLKDMDVVEVPTFLFIRDGKICGRYVGSGKGELIGEILRYQGVRVT